MNYTIEDRRTTTYGRRQDHEVVWRFIALVCWKALQNDLDLLHLDNLLHLCCYTINYFCLDLLNGARLPNLWSWAWECQLC